MSTTLTTFLLQGTSRGIRTARALLYLWVLVAFAAVSSQAQTAINPATTTTLFGGQPNLTNAPADFTVPRGGIVLYGTAISAITGRPVRHLWVGDNTFGLCRTDPEIDAPGSHDINPNTCPFKLGGQSVTGGPLVFDPATNFLYLVDVRRSQGVYRLHFLPDGDTGQGFLDFTTIFAMAGNPTAARFQGGQTGCSLPTNSTLPTNPTFGAVDFAALGPDGNLWVAGTKSGAILRINNPATASSTGFGTCNDFVQLVATTPDNGSVNGLAWIGHDLWGADATAPFVIPNADTTCQALGSTPTQTPTCTATTALAAVGAVTTMTGDQQFPQLNGNNLYFATTAPGQLLWAGNIAGVQTLDSAVINAAQLPQPAAPATPFPPLGSFGATAVDYTDPSNFAVYSGEDASNAGALGAGRWWQTCLGSQATHCNTPTATAAPQTPTIIRGAGGIAKVTLSWSAVQNNQPISSYTIHNSFASSGGTLADIVVNPVPPNPFPSTTVTIPVAAGRTYTFQVKATNAQGSSLFTSPSSPVSALATVLPGIPTQVRATDGNRAASVAWAAPAGTAPITSYTVTALALNPATGAFATTAITATAAATATTAVVNGLTNGITYDFSVHASNAAGAGLESTPSNPVTPGALSALAVSMGGPTSLLTTPIQVTYPVTITNNTTQAFNTVTLTDTLTTTDGAFIVLAQPTQGTCATGGTGVVSIACSLGSVAASATAQVNVIVQIQAAAVTNNVSVVADGGTPATASVTTAPPPAGGAVSVPLSITGNAQVPTPNIGQAGNIVWTISNVSQTKATAVLFTNVVPAGLILNTITFAENNPTNGTLLCTYTPNGGNSVPCPAGALNNNQGATIQVLASGLGGSTAGGAKPPQTMTVTVNVTAPNASGTAFVSTGNVSFGPGGTDTLPSSSKVTISVK